MPTKTQQNTTVIAVFVKQKHGIVKHWRHADQTNTLCEERVIVEAQPSGISRECVICQRLKVVIDQRK